MVTPYEIAHAKALAEAPKMTGTNAQSYTQSLKKPETGMQKMQREISAGANGGRNWAPTTGVPIRRPAPKPQPPKNKPIVYGSLEYTQQQKKPYVPAARTGDQASQRQPPPIKKQSPDPKKPYPSPNPNAAGTVGYETSSSSRIPGTGWEWIPHTELTPSDTTTPRWRKKK